MRLDEADERLSDAGEASVVVEGRRSRMRSPVMANSSEAAVMAVWNFDETIHCYVIWQTWNQFFHLCVLFQSEISKTEDFGNGIWVLMI